MIIGMTKANAGQSSSPITFDGLGLDGDAARLVASFSVANPEFAAILSEELMRLRNASSDSERRAAVTSFNTAVRARLLSKNGTES